MADINQYLPNPPPVLQPNLFGTASRYITATMLYPSFDADPTNPAVNSVWINTSEHALKYYDGTSVQTLQSWDYVS